MRRELLECSYDDMRDVDVRAVPHEGPRLSWSHIVAAAELRRGRKEFDDGLASDAAWYFRDVQALGYLASNWHVPYGQLADGIHQAWVSSQDLGAKLVLDMLATWALNGPDD